MVCLLRLLAIFCATNSFVYVGETARSTAPSYRDGEAWNEACSDQHLQWLRTYIRKHREERERAESKYLVYPCGIDGSSGHRDHSHHCPAGVAERVRGIMFLLRLAEASGRILLINSTQPAQMQLLQPSGLLNWLPPTLSHNPAQLDVYKDIMPKLQDGSFDQVKDRLVVWAADEREDENYPGLPEIKRPWADLHSRLGRSQTVRPPGAGMWHALFKPSEAVTKVSQLQLEHLKFTNQTNYTIIHLRLGAATGDIRYHGQTMSTGGITDWCERGFQVQGESALPLVMSSIECAKALAAAHGYTDTRLVMITDHPILRKFLAAGMVENVVSYRVQASQLQGDLKAMEGPVASVVDMLIMAHANCQVAGLRGFSNIAHWWSGDSCHRNIHSAMSATVPRVQECPSEHWKADDAGRRQLLVGGRRGCGM
ncbi:hypothetical protein QJQ45_005057 [Haematococcus lacustris]|nr:hypothetical protein QJQ45_005057 [Haematococcus lacustris]